MITGLKTVDEQEMPKRRGRRQAVLTTLGDRLGQTKDRQHRKEGGTMMEAYFD